MSDFILGKKFFFSISGGCQKRGPKVRWTFMEPGYLRKQRLYHMNFQKITFINQNPLSYNLDLVNQWMIKGQKLFSTDFLWTNSALASTNLCPAGDGQCGRGQNWVILASRHCNPSGLSQYYRFYFLLQQLKTTISTLGKGLHFILSSHFAVLALYHRSIQSQICREWS